jgi:16S rRNA (cytidine1402-2'-O)-methyltransferase
LRAQATTIWYESPQRIAATLADLAAVAADAQVFLVREYTKRFEQQVLGTPLDVAAALSTPVRGEIAFAIAPYAPAAIAPAALDLDAEIDLLLERGASVAEIARDLVRRGAGERRDLYARASERKSARR